MTELQTLFHMLDKLAPKEVRQVQQYLAERHQLSEEEAFHAALDDIVRWHNPNDETYPEPEITLEEIRETLSKTRSLSEIIIEERSEQL